MSKSQRRELKFQSWDDVIADLQRLGVGCQQHGSWNLEQIAKHLTAWLSFPMDGFPKPGFPANLLMSILRLTAGKHLLRKILATEKMSDGGPTVPTTVYEATDESGTKTALDELYATIDRFRRYDGPIIASPIFGSMDKETAQRLQHIHFAHHLSWLTATETTS